MHACFTHARVVGVAAAYLWPCTVPTASYSLTMADYRRAAMAALRHGLPAAAGGPGAAEPGGVPAGAGAAAGPAGARQHHCPQPRLVCPPAVRVPCFGTHENQGKKNILEEGKKVELKGEGKGGKQLRSCSTQPTEACLLPAEVPCWFLCSAYWPDLVSTAACAGAA